MPGVKRKFVAAVYTVTLEADEFEKHDRRWRMQGMERVALYGVKRAGLAPKLPAPLPAPQAKPKPVMEPKPKPGRRPRSRNRTEADGCSVTFYAYRKGRTPGHGVHIILPEHARRIFQPRRGDLFWHSWDQYGLTITFSRTQPVQGLKIRKMRTTGRTLVSVSYAPGRPKGEGPHYNVPFRVDERAGTVSVMLEDYYV